MLTGKFLYVIKLIVSIYIPPVPQTALSLLLLHQDCLLIPLCPDCSVCYIYCRLEDYRHNFSLNHLITCLLNHYIFYFGFIRTPQMSVMIGFAHFMYLFIHNVTLMVSFFLNFFYRHIFKKL